jgi:hypothetical protein
MRSKKIVEKKAKSCYVKKKEETIVYQNQRKFILVIQELCINVTIRLNFG